MDQESTRSSEEERAHTISWLGAKWESLWTDLQNLRVILIAVYRAKCYQSEQQNPQMRN